MPQILCDYLPAEEEEEEKENDEQADKSNKKMARIHRQYVFKEQCSSANELESKMPNKNDFLKKQVK